MSRIFGFSIKNCFEIGNYILDLENITGQCNRRLDRNWIAKAELFKKVPINIKSYLIT